jgi:hypothetical protein
MSKFSSDLVSVALVGLVGFLAWLAYRALTAKLPSQPAAAEVAVEKGGWKLQFAKFGPFLSFILLAGGGLVVISFRSPPHAETPQPYEVTTYKHPAYYPPAYIPAPALPVRTEGN